MDNKHIYFFLIMSLIVFLGCLGFRFYSYIQFRLLIKKNNLVSMLDNKYELSIYLVGILYTALYISGMFDTFRVISADINAPLPFVVYALPFMVLSYNILVNEGLYAYNHQKLFIGVNQNIDKGNIKIVKSFRSLLINRAKVVVEVNNTTKMKNKNYVIRTSLSNVKAFIELYGK